MISKRILSEFYSNFKHFCCNTSLHGFAFVGDPFLTHVERVVWLIVICVQFLFCFLYARSVINYSNTDPTFLAFESKVTSGLEVKCKMKSWISVWYSFHSISVSVSDIYHLWCTVLAWKHKLGRLNWGSDGNDRSRFEHNERKRSKYFGHFESTIRNLHSKSQWKCFDWLSQNCAIYYSMVTEWI